MDKQTLAQLERFQARLESERQLLLSELESWLKQQADFSCVSLLDRLYQLTGDELLEALHGIESSTAKKYRTRLQAIDASLCQLEIGLYGYCADCEQSIEPELLQRDPATQRCKRCDEAHQKNKNLKHRILL